MRLPLPADTEELKEIFEKNDLNEIKKIKFKLNQNIEESNDVLRNTVGKRYQELLFSALTVSNLRDKSLAMVQGIESLSDKVNTVLREALIVSEKTCPQFIITHDALKNYLMQINFLLLTAKEHIDYIFIYKMLSDFIYQSYAKDLKLDEKELWITERTIKTLHHRIFKIFKSNIVDQLISDEKIYTYLCFLAIIDKSFLKPIETFLNMSFQHISEQFSSINFITSKINEFWVFFHQTLIRVKELLLIERITNISNVLLPNNLAISDILSKIGISKQDHPLAVAFKLYLNDKMTDYKNLKALHDNKNLNDDEIGFVHDWIKRVLALFYKKMGDYMLSEEKQPNDLKSDSYVKYPKDLFPSMITVCAKFLFENQRVWESTCQSLRLTNRVFEIECKTNDKNIFFENISLDPGNVITSVIIPLAISSMVDATNTYLQAQIINTQNNLAKLDKESFECEKLVSIKYNSDFWSNLSHVQLILPNYSLDLVKHDILSKNENKNYSASFEHTFQHVTKKLCDTISASIELVLSNAKELCDTIFFKNTSIFGMLNNHINNSTVTQTSNNDLSITIWFTTQLAQYVCHGLRDYIIRLTDILMSYHHVDTENIINHNRATILIRLLTQLQQTLNKFKCNTVEEIFHNLIPFHMQSDTHVSVLFDNFHENGANYDNKNTYAVEYIECQLHQVLYDDWSKYQAKKLFKQIQPKLYSMIEENSIFEGVDDLEAYVISNPPNKVNFEETLDTKSDSVSENNSIQEKGFKDSNIGVNNSKVFIYLPKTCSLWIQELLANMNNEIYEAFDWQYLGSNIMDILKKEVASVFIIEYTTRFEHLTPNTLIQTVALQCYFDLVIMEHLFGVKKFPELYNKFKQAKQILIENHIDALEYELISERLQTNVICNISKFSHAS